MASQTSNAVADGLCEAIEEMLSVADEPGLLLPAQSALAWLGAWRKLIQAINGMNIPFYRFFRIAIVRIQCGRCNHASIPDDIAVASPARTTGGDRTTHLFWAHAMSERIYRARQNVCCHAHD